MARKNIARKKIASGVSLATAFQSELSNVQWLDNVGYIIETSGVTDNTGTFSVQVRNTTSDDPNEQSQWANLTLTAVPTLANANAVFAINLNQLPFSEVRVAFTPAGITPDGTVTIWASIKQVGG